MIYLVEDEESIRELVVYTLCSTGLTARGFANAEEFWSALRELKPSLVLLDIMLPGEDGLEILRRLREAPDTAKLPVMMLTARGTEYDKVRGLELGADDYLAKPPGMMELVARVKRLLRRADGDGDREEYSVGGLFVSVPRRLVTVNGEEVNLTLMVFGLLEFLLRNAGLVMTRDKLLSAVWGYNYEGETRTVDTHILTLRGKLGPCGSVIQTVRGVGYKAGEAK
ncbi:MAG: response regulator transcription factor [Oscillospiraceae bacterium]|jgi:two-component system alkaline phosphatase synthesis response regulator PhoP|nr:response regulator transcription factor [Oscillospiraceae bacterium]